MMDNEYNNRGTKYTINKKKLQIEANKRLDELHKKRL